MDHPLTKHHTTHAAMNWQRHLIVVDCGISGFIVNFGAATHHGLICGLLRIIVWTPMLNGSSKSANTLSTLGYWSSPLPGSRMAKAGTPVWPRTPLIWQQYGLARTLLRIGVS